MTAPWLYFHVNAFTFMLPLNITFELQLNWLHFSRWLEFETILLAREMEIVIKVANKYNKFHAIFYWL